MDRRDFLRKGTLFAGVAANLPPNRPEWMKHSGASATPRSEGPSVPGLKRMVFESQGSHTPLQKLSGIITPTDVVFERHHNGVPRIDADAHRLMIHGLVERPLLLTMDELARFPSVSRLHFLECSGNSATRWNTRYDENATAQNIHGALSCCEWTGVPLSVVLAEVGVKKEAKWVLAEGADADAFTRSIPIEKALSDTLLVYAQNGEWLRPEHGYPLRLLLPGFEGSMSVKWLRRLKVGDMPFDTREETAKYTDLMPDGKARRHTFVMDAKSVITFPSGGQKLWQKGACEISGIAWSGRGSIKAVEVSVDGGKHWGVANLPDAVLPRCLTRFSLSWRWEGGPALLMSRAIDETGYVQPSLLKLKEVRGERSFYHNNAIQCWSIGAEGEVRHVEV
jgi:sulfane dehydrogenase subunit SoxC